MVSCGHFFDCLRTAVLDTSTEASFQRGVARALEDGGVVFEREARLGPGDRIDFVLDDTIGLELKIGDHRAPVLRQLERYARHAHIVALALCTTKSSHLQLPHRILGKPLVIYCRTAHGQWDIRRAYWRDRQGAPRTRFQCPECGMDFTRLQRSSHVYSGSWW